MKTRPPRIMDKVLVLHNLGRSSIEIANELNLTRSVVYTAIRRLERNGSIQKRGQIDLEKNYDIMLEYREQQERRALMASSRKLLHRLEEVYGSRIYKGKNNEPSVL